MIRTPRPQSRIVRISGAGLALFALVLTAAAPAAADPLGSAKARAAALAASEARLTTQAEVATERYDAVEQRLSQAVSTQVAADQALDAAGASAAAARATVSNGVQALYESGGNVGLLASILVDQDPTGALNRYQLASDVLGYEARRATSAGTVVTRASELESHDAAAAHAVTRLQVAAGAAAAAVQSTLARQRAQLAAAQADVRRIAAADQAATTAAGQRDFIAALSQAGGSIAGSTATPPNATAATAIAAARSRLGDPYVWGATGPDTFDCSGLTQWAYAHAGIQLPRVAADQWNAGPHPALNALLPGDLLFWATDTANPATIHHVALYIGQGLMIAAPHTGENVQIQPVYMTGFIGATRPWAPIG